MMIILSVLKFIGIAFTVLLPIDISVIGMVFLLRKIITRNQYAHQYLLALQGGRSIQKYQEKQK